MTLVVGRISGGSVNMVSDTMLTNELTKAPIPITKRSNQDQDHNAYVGRFIRGQCRCGR